MLEKRITTITEQYNEKGVLIKKSTLTEEFEYHRDTDSCENAVSDKVVPAKAKAFFPVPSTVMCKKESSKIDFPPMIAISLK